jgi:hypothetical protein
MRGRVAALIVCLCAAGCGDDDTASSSDPQGCDAGAARCNDAGSTRHHAATPHDAGTQHAPHFVYYDAGAQQHIPWSPQDAGVQHDAAGSHGGGGADDAGDDDAGTAQDAGTPPVITLFNLRPDHDCRYYAEPVNVFYPTGRYDIATQGNCDHPYMAHLLVRSTWQNKTSVTQLLHVDSATITLETTDKNPVQFGDGKPNPFLTTTSLSFESADNGEMYGVAELEVVPVGYKAGLTQFADQQIYALIELHASTSSKRAVEAMTFLYPIEICIGCLTVCTSYLDAQKLTREDLIGDHCDDESGNDERVCIDTGC